MSPLTLLSDTPLPEFPDPNNAPREGLLAVGGALRVEWLQAAYSRGIFPWYSEGEPIMWWSPDPRAILYPDQIRISRSLGKCLQQNRFKITLDTQFTSVIRACASPRPSGGDPATWITAAMEEAYSELHHAGIAHSVEVWLEGNLVGGLYGVSVGSVFCGESMFSQVSNASKVALVLLCRLLSEWGYQFIDCQLPTAHLISLGAVSVSRSHFLAALKAAGSTPPAERSWSSLGEIS